MARQKKQTEPTKKCFDCEHYHACSMWNVGTLQFANATNCSNYEPSMVLVRIELDRLKAELKTRESG